MSVALLAVGAIVLVVSGVSHVRDRVESRATLDRHAVLPTSVRRPSAVLLPALQLALGLALLGAIVTGAQTASVRLGGVASALFLVFALYLHLAARKPGAAGAPCGCGLGEAPLGVWVVVRAVLFAALSAVGAAGVATTNGLDATTAGGLAGAAGVAEAIVSVAAVASLVVAISVLPAARAVRVVPGGDR